MHRVFLYLFYMNQTSKTRCFIALPLPTEIKKEIVRVQQELKKEDLFKGKYTHPQNIHLTLKFLGEISDEELINVKERLQKINFSPFEIQLSDPGVFSRRHIRIIWMHLLGATEIQSKIDCTLSTLYEKEKRFMSHITLARVKRVKNKNQLLTFIDRIQYAAISASVNQVYLMKSTLSPDGPIYHVLETYP